MNRLRFALLIGVTILAGCSTAGDPATIFVSPTDVTAAIDVPREVISLRISLYLIVNDQVERDPEISTHRSEADLREILEGMNDIWSQAGIRLELQTIESVVVPEVILRGILAGNLGPFFRELGASISLPEAATINGFYIRRLGGPNGVNPFGSNTFFVVDEPSVFDRRVISHEIGHILGLNHVPGDPGRLMYSGTNGMTLTAEEAIVARYFAQAMIQGVR